MEVAEGVRYKATAATHGRQLPVLLLLYAGSVHKPMHQTPRQASDFKVGENYAFLFELSNDQATNTIYPGFESIRVPSVGSVLRLEGKAGP